MERFLGGGRSFLGFIPEPPSFLSLGQGQFRGFFGLRVTQLHQLSAAKLLYGEKMKLRNIGTLLLIGLFLALSSSAEAQQKKPNILIIWGDDIGIFNVSAYNMGMMGYKTPNIDRIGREGAIFTDWYGQQSCTAGRAAFITGLSPIPQVSPKLDYPARRKA